ncbi:ABC protein [Exidia glandulosa HHB12029]|uniref:ABC protein n=1 Tax=Exidia glandulosa HHB12029 TaxID=1314781 RepID=A0A165N0A5_EXIGL|nr:ABC protein [Exidia glandulosa HHB12029]
MAVENEKLDEKAENAPETAPNKHHAHHLDDAVVEGVYRERWYQIWRPSDPPPPPPKSLDEARELPIAHEANILSILTYQWLSPMMSLGYQRPLQATDLWKVDKSREAGVLSKKLDDAWDRRVREAAEWNARLDKGEIKPGLLKRTRWTVAALARGSGWRERLQARQDRWRTRDGRKEASLAWALNEPFAFEFWSGGLFKVVGDTAQLMGPLISKAIINFAKERATARQNGDPMPSVGRGVGMAIGLFWITVVASVSQHQFFWRSMSTGVLARAALISSLYKRGMGLTPKSRTIHRHADLVNHISTDVSRIDYAAQWFHAFWTAPIQISICLIILLVQLGPSALAGFSLFLLIIPFQQRAMAAQLSVRQGSMKWTDQRARLLQELLGAMRVIKYFCYEKPFLKRIDSIRKEELKGIRKILYIRAANLGVAFSIPVLAAVLAFITYVLSGHSLDPAIIFTSLSLFQLLRQPLMFLPRALAAISDAQNALQRLRRVYCAELMTESPFEVNTLQKEALKVVDADFQWEETEADEGSAGGGKGKKKDKEKEKAVRDVDPSQPPFALRDISMSVPRGTIVAIAGRVGSGKSSLLQGLIGEMKRLKGEVAFGSTVGYCSQVAWIQNATLRENVIFGREWEEDRYWRAIENASLLPDLELLPDGDLTEIGEKGINLSGGQKQRVNIARALYYDADIVLMDDPLSAVDAHVGQALFTDAIIGQMKNRGKTVILVTHALHFLHQVDYIYTMVDGRIAEFGTYDTLMQNGGTFSRLIAEFGGEHKNDDEDEVEDEKKQITASGVKKSTKGAGKAAGTGKIEGRLIVAEKRTIGALKLNVYSTYLRAGKAWLTLPLVIACAVLMQVAQTTNTYTLVWWQNDTFHQPYKFYIGLYAGLGIGQAVFTFLLGVTMGWMSIYVSRNMHYDAVHKVFHAPMQFFDTTPLGRILGVFGKDIDTIDNTLSDSMRMLVLTLGNVFGSVIIITVVEHYFIIAVLFISVGYQYFAAYYRRSAREMKRLDANLRSLLYAHFSESLSGPGMATIRAYRESNRFVSENEYFVDLEDRALFLTITNQRWLAIRLDFLGATMIFAVGMLVVFGVNGVSPAQTGLILSYTTSLTQMFGMVTRQSAEVENNMNSVERVSRYVEDGEIEQEPPHEDPTKAPPTSWPSEGRVEFKDVTMAYRKDLPPVLNSISMDISPGEKIGVVGRTGAGKSSLLMCLYRIVELAGGSIQLDGIDISTLPLTDLRSKISIIPQDPLLFSGTIRSNLDPFSLFEDARLWDALRRAHLIAPESSRTSSDELTLALDEPAEKQFNKTRFTLETVVESEGANLSVGERSLLSLARALVKDSKVIVLDEATASVDLETDSKIQHTIQTEFQGHTLICIAHRLRTILSYDRILVLDAGRVIEFDTPLNLFLREGGIFRSMCEGSGITSAEIEKA